MELVNGSANNRITTGGATASMVRALRDALADSAQENAKADASALATFSERPWCLLLFAGKSKGSGDAPLGAQDFERASVPNIAIEADGDIVVFVSHADAGTLADEFVPEGLKSHLTALSLPFSDLSAIPRQYDFVRYCLESSGKLVGKRETNALAYLKKSILESVNVSAMLHPALEVLERYDRENQSEMLETLRVYLDNDRNAQRCANLLYLHRNSLQYRVRRIQEIAGIDLDDPTERAYLRLSLFLSS